MLCILYTIAAGSCFGLAALLFERLTPPGRRRWIWCASIVLSVVVPASYKTQHNAPVAWAAAVGAFDPVMLRVWDYATWLVVALGVASILRAALLVRASHQEGRSMVVDGVKVTVTNSLGPAAVGFLRSRIVIPRWVLGLPKEQRAYVLRHEVEHASAFDALLLFMMSIVLVGAPWYLAVYWQLRRLAIAVEVDCDNRVVRAHGDPQKYSHLLFNIAQAAHHSSGLQPGFLGGAGALERRLRQLTAPQKLSRGQKLGILAMATALILLVLIVPHPATGIKKLIQQLPALYDGEVENGLTPTIKALLNTQYSLLLCLTQWIEECDISLEKIASEDERCQRLLAIEGIGVKSVVAIVALVGNGQGFKNGRHFAAFLGLVPKQHSSGDKETLLGISKRGNSYLRQLFIHGARAVVKYASKKTDPRSEWIKQLKARRGANRAAVAVANKNARIVMAMLLGQTNYCKALS